MNLLRGWRDAEKLQRTTEWQKSYSICLHIFKVTKGYPGDEIYELSAQMRRASVSVPSNIAEGYGRKSTKQYINHLYISYGSICEIETQLLLSRDLPNLKENKFSEINSSLFEVERMLEALINSLERKLN